MICGVRPVYVHDKEATRFCHSACVRRLLLLRKFLIHRKQGSNDDRQKKQIWAVCNGVKESQTNRITASGLRTYCCIKISRPFQLVTTCRVPNNAGLCAVELRKLPGLHDIPNDTNVR